MLCDASLSARRVWIEIIVLYTVSVSSWSLSARRVWIEIFVRSSICISFLVTLCEESVDWNSVLLSNGIISYRHSLRGECGLKSCSCTRLACRYMSLSARRVWIEILLLSVFPASVSVTLCEESVDWNRNVWLKRWARPCHSLRGECGLKSGLPKYLDRATWVTLCEESVDWNRPDCLCVPLWLVTLCEESVDWNKKWLKILIHELFVTLCEESVDWNVERYL